MSKFVYSDVYSSITQNRLSGELFIPESADKTAGRSLYDVALNVLISLHHCLLLHVVLYIIIFLNIIFIPILGTLY